MVGTPRHVVLGGSGFIGRHVALALLRRGDPVLIAGRTSPPLPAADRAGLRFVPLDFAEADWGAVLQDGDVVHHYAWSTIPTTANDDPLSDLDINLRGTLRLLQAARARRGVRVLFSSSGGTVYGPAARRPIPESDDLQPMTAYGVSKVAAEKYLGFYRALHGLDTRIARLSNPYGIGQNIERRQGAISAFLRRMAAGQPIEIWGDGSVVRDFLHIDDAVRGLLALADASPEALPALPVFNLGSGTGLSLNELLGILRGLAGPDLAVERHPGRRFDVPWNVLDIALARRHLGWAPRIAVADGIAMVMRDGEAGRSEFSSLPSFPPLSVPQLSARSIHLRTTGAR
jgi:UDP-glucose 4-epimerase